ncbi:hypothetical protein AB0D10_38300 [Kitasatospora sp. NPDC048545]|uniref:hypothetical protein n=1 Tax=Kitasatospora sp. NPDC048545 TaxID=3157208 RepID=UPI0033F83F29
MGVNSRTSGGWAGKAAAIVGAAALAGLAPVALSAVSADGKHEASSQYSAPAGTQADRTEIVPANFRYFA